MNERIKIYYLTLHCSNVGTGPGKRDPQRATLAGVEGVHQTGHAVWHFPLGDRIRVKKRTIDICARCVYAFLADGGLIDHP
jgi:hypothetical protein